LKEGMRVELHAIALIKQTKNKKIKEKKIFKYPNR